MEKRLVRNTNGQELRNQDLITLGDSSGLADDRVLWELMRLQPGAAAPQKGIIPYAVSGAAVPGVGDGFAAGMSNTALVQGGTADAKVRVMPFKAVVGSTTLFATSPLEKLRGIRSGYCVGASSLYTSVSVAANASGQPRWTLVYAAIAPDVDGDTAVCKVKDPTSGVVSNSALVLNRVTQVVISSVDGATGASPVRPPLPADGAGTYYIELAYLFVPTGFGAGTAVANYQIHEVAKVLQASPATGVASMAPATEQWKAGGVVDLAQNPSRNTVKRGGAYVPPTMTGLEGCFILLQLGASPVSHADGDFVDKSRDWRNRFFDYRAYIASGTSTFASDLNAGGRTGGSYLHSSGLGVDMAIGGGQSFWNDYPGLAVATCSGIAVFLAGNSSAASATTNTNTSLGATGDYVRVYVDSTTGFLKLKYSFAGSACQVLIWLYASSPFANAA